MRSALHGQGGVKIFEECTVSVLAEQMHEHHERVVSKRVEIAQKQAKGVANTTDLDFEEGGKSS